MHSPLLTLNWIKRTEKSQKLDGEIAKGNKEIDDKNKQLEEANNQINQANADTENFAKDANGVIR